VIRNFDIPSTDTSSERLFARGAYLKPIAKKKNCVELNLTAVMVFEAVGMREGTRIKMQE